jgi:hypothetical protein
MSNIKFNMEDLGVMEETKEEIEHVETNEQGENLSMSLKHSTPGKKIRKKR